MAVRNHIITVSFVILIVVLSIFFNNTIISIRLSEIDHHLHRVALDNHASQTFSIVSRYELIKRRIESDEPDLEQYKDEGRVQAILSLDTLPERKGDVQSLSKWHPAQVVLSGLRFILGKEQIQNESNDAAHFELEQAYLLERNRQYERALHIYDSLIEAADYTRKVEASLLMHKAFCLSMLSNFKKSAETYKEVISRFPQSPEGALSQKLLAFIQSMQKQKEQITSAKADAHEVGKKLYSYMDYKGAIKELDTYLKKKDAKQKNSAHFYKGRAHEELGEYKYAVHEYRQVMNLGKESSWSRKANRRLVILGDFYKQRHTTISKARENLVQHGDTLFIKEVKSISKIKKESPEEVKSKESGTILPSTISEDTLVNVLDSAMAESVVVDSLDTVQVDSILIDTGSIEDIYTALVTSTEMVITSDTVKSDSLDSVQVAALEREAEQNRRRLQREKAILAAKEIRRQRQEAKRLREEALRLEKEEALRIKEEAEKKQRALELKKQKEEERKKKLLASDVRRPAYIQKILRRNSKELIPVFQKYAPEIETLDGKVVVEMTIAASGEVDASIHSSNIKHRHFRKALIYQIELWSFPSVDKDLGEIKIRYPFVFKQSRSE